jgi:hypothetical protein
LSAEKGREKISPIDSNLHHLPTIFSGSGIQQQREGLVSMAARFCSARGSEEGANGWQEREFQRGCRALYAEVGPI